MDKNNRFGQDGIDLKKIYPTPKSYEELENVQKKRAREHEKQKPRHIIISTALWLHTILIGAVLGLALAFFLIKFNIMSGVFFSFLLLLILMAYSFWIITRISSAFYQLGFSVGPFLLVYAGTFITLFSLSQLVLMDANLFVQFALATVLHYLVVYILLKLMLNSRAM